MADDMVVSEEESELTATGRPRRRCQKYNLRRASAVARVSLHEDDDPEEDDVKPATRHIKGKVKVKRGKSKHRPPPLSKYRRRSANARERQRMAEINDAFEVLKGALPERGLARAVEEESGSGGKAGKGQPTKIAVLRLAINYIDALRDVLANPDPQPLDTPLGEELVLDTPLGEELAALDTPLGGELAALEEPQSPTDNGGNPLSDIVSSAQSQPSGDDNLDKDNAAIAAIAQRPSTPYSNQVTPLCTQSESSAAPASQSSQLQPATTSTERLPDTVAISPVATQTSLNGLDVLASPRHSATSKRDISEMETDTSSISIFPGLRDVLTNQKGPKAFVAETVSRLPSNACSPLPASLLEGPSLNSSSSFPYSSSSEPTKSVNRFPFTPIPPTSMILPSISSSFLCCNKVDVSSSASSHFSESMDVPYSNRNSRAILSNKDHLDRQLGFRNNVSFEDNQSIAKMRNYKTSSKKVKSKNNSSIGIHDSYLSCKNGYVTNHRFGVVRKGGACIVKNEFAESCNNGASTLSQRLLDPPIPSRNVILTSSVTGCGRKPIDFNNNNSSVINNNYKTYAHNFNGNLSGCRGHLSRWALPKPPSFSIDRVSDGKASLPLTSNAFSSPPSSLCSSSSSLSSSSSAPSASSGDEESLVSSDDLDLTSTMEELDFLASSLGTHDFSRDLASGLGVHEFSRDLGGNDFAMEPDLEATLGPENTRLCLELVASVL